MGIFKRFFLMIMLNLFVITAFAADNIPCQPGTPNCSPIATPVVNQPAAVISQDYCPEPQSLAKEELIWNAPGGWTSYSESFDKQIVGFIKAEWIGVNVGKIICLYKGNQTNSFPVALELKHNKLVPTPTGGQWRKEQKGHKECIANNIKDCPFQFEKPTEHNNLYQELDFFKGKKDQNND